jgi:hypothetical protein
MKLSINVAQFTAAVQTSYLAALSAATGVPVSRHKIQSFVAASLLVTVLVTPDPTNSSAVSPAAVAASLAAQAQLGSSALVAALASVAPVVTSYVPVVSVSAQVACADGSFAAALASCPVAPATPTAAPPSYTSPAVFIAAGVGGAVVIALLVATFLRRGCCGCGGGGDSSAAQVAPAPVELAGRQNAYAVVKVAATKK